jgi:hypothetical protein
MILFLGLWTSQKGAMGDGDDAGMQRVTSITRLTRTVARNAANEITLSVGMD